MPYKTCPQCKLKNGPRTQWCKCGYAFAAKEKEPKEEKQELKEEAEPQQEEKPIGLPKVYAIAGNLPAYDGDLEAWLQSLENLRPANDVTLGAAVNALIHVGGDAPLVERVKEIYRKREQL